jgi:hypothetical protein
MLPQSIPLAFMGLPQCTLLTLHTVAVPALTDGNGRASFSIAVPPGGPTGDVYGQWLVLDPPGMSLALSNGVRITVGAP